MKKSIALFILFCLFSNAQTYTFDYILSTNYIDLNNPKENSKKISGIHNSKNSDFEMIIRSEDAYIFDYKKNEIQKFFIKKNSKTSLEFINRKNRSNYNPEKLYYNIIKKNDLEFFIEIFRNKKKKKPSIILEVKLKESDENFIYLHGHFNGKSKAEIGNNMKSMLDSTKKYVVKSSIIEYNNGNRYQYDYEIYKKINLTIVVK